MLKVFIEGRLLGGEYIVDFKYFLQQYRFERNWVLIEIDLLLEKCVNQFIGVFVFSILYVFYSGYFFLVGVLYVNCELDVLIFVLVFLVVFDVDDFYSYQLIL